MQTINLLQALEYVRMMERSWNLGCYHDMSIYQAWMVEVTDFASNRLVVIGRYTVAEITMNNGNHWTVWIEPDGRVYGEC